MNDSRYSALTLTLSQKMVFLKFKTILCLSFSFNGGSQLQSKLKKRNNLMRGVSFQQLSIFSLEENICFPSAEQKYIFNNVQKRNNSEKSHWIERITLKHFFLMNPSCVYLILFCCRNSGLGHLPLTEKLLNALNS